jgi:hypothetical protein
LLEATVSHRGFFYYSQMFTTVHKPNSQRTSSLPVVERIPKDENLADPFEYTRKNIRGKAETLSFSDRGNPPGHSQHSEQSLAQIMSHRGVSLC